MRDEEMRTLNEEEKNGGLMMSKISSSVCSVMKRHAYNRRIASSSDMLAVNNNNAPLPFEGAPDKTRLIPELCCGGQKGQSLELEGSRELSDSLSEMMRFVTPQNSSSSYIFRTVNIPEPTDRGL